MNHDFIFIDSEDSDHSVVEVEVPRKPSPPLIEIDGEELMLNVNQPNTTKILAKEFIEMNFKSGYSSTIIEQQLQCNIETNPNYPNHWTPDMIKYYNDDWGDEENFVVEKLQEKMNKSRNLWDVSLKGFRYYQKPRKSRAKCNNCLETGHNASYCPKPPYVPICYMCGIQGHLVNNCPNSLCLNCGNKMPNFSLCCQKCRNQNIVCSRCTLGGHNCINCTDHWRMFHITTSGNNINIPDVVSYKKDKDMWCCNCGKKGHYPINCLYHKDMKSFPETLPFIASYQRNILGSSTKKKSKKSRSKKFHTFKKKENRKAFGQNEDRRYLGIEKNKKLFKKSKKRKKKNSALKNSRLEQAVLKYF